MNPVNCRHRENFVAFSHNYFLCYKKNRKINRKAVLDLSFSFLCQFHTITAWGAMWCWQSEIRARVCQNDDSWSQVWCWSRFTRGFLWLHGDTHYLIGWWPAEPRLTVGAEITCKISCDNITCMHIHVYITYICIYIHLHIYKWLRP